MNAVAASALLNQGVTTGAAVAHAALQQKQTEQHVISAITKSMRAAQDLTQMSTSSVVGQPLPPPKFPFPRIHSASYCFP